MSEKKAVVGRNLSDIFKQHFKDTWGHSVAAGNLNAGNLNRL